MKCLFGLKRLLFCFCFFSRPGFLFFFKIQESLDVVLCRSEVRHPLLGFSVFPVSLLLLGNEFCVFFVQLFYRRKFFHTQIGKCLLRCFMKSDLFAVSVKEGFTVSRFSVGHIGILSLGIIQNMRFLRPRSLPFFSQLT